MFGHTSKTEKIFVVDNALDYSNQEALFNFCKNSLYSFGHGASSVSVTDMSRFICNLTAEELSRTGLDQLFRTLVKKYKKRDVHIDRSYINVYFPYTPTGMHTDDNDPDAISFLAYANPQWNLDWAGETQFFSSDLAQVEQSILPQGGRVIVFDSNIPHSARAPAVICPIPRFTVTIKGFLA